MNFDTMRGDDDIPFFDRKSNRRRRPHLLEDHHDMIIMPPEMNHYESMPAPPRANSVIPLTENPSKMSTKHEPIEGYRVSKIKRGKRKKAHGQSYSVLPPIDKTVEPNADNGDSIKEKGTEDRIEIVIQKLLLVSKSSFSSTCCIYQSPESVRIYNIAAYKPKLISIGPHHIKSCTEWEDELKRVYCGALMKHGGKSLPLIIKHLDDSKLKVYGCYEETGWDYLPMMLVHSCFIIEHLRRSHFPNLRDPSDNIPVMVRRRSQIRRDLLLLDNQIPYFLLESLYELLTPAPGDAPAPAPTDAPVPAPAPAPGDAHAPADAPAPAGVDDPAPAPGDAHALAPTPATVDADADAGVDVPAPADALTHADTPSLPQLKFEDLVMSFFEKYKRNDDMVIDFKSVQHFTDLIRTLHKPTPKDIDDRQNYDHFEYTLSATQLCSAGIEFKAAASGSNLLDIDYKNGILTLPCFELNGDQESLYRNLMAFELCHYPDDTYIIDYFVFMDTLINTAQDISILIQSGVLVNRIGDQSDAADTFNKFCAGITHYKVTDSYLLPVLWGLNKYYQNPSHTHMTTFKRDYFGTPLRTASTITAVTLVVLTFISTVCTIISII